MTLLGNVHEKLPEAGSMSSILFPNFGSMFSSAEPQDKENEESLVREGEGYASEGGWWSPTAIYEAPLISHQTTTSENPMQGDREGVGGTGIGVTWKWSEGGCGDGNKGGLRGFTCTRRVWHETWLSRLTPWW